MLMSLMYGNFTSTEDFIIYALGLLLAMLIAIPFHEVAHAFVAYKLGDPTAKNLGRLSLDPMRHFDLFGTLAFLLIGMGWAKPVMVNVSNFKKPRRDDVLVSIAGPAMNLILAFIFYGLFLFIPGLISSPANFYIGRILYTIVSINMVFMVFNLLPIPPLDGFHVVSSAFIRKRYYIVDFLRQYGFVILIVLLFTNVLDPVFNFVIGGLQSLFLSFYSLFL